MYVEDAINAGLPYIDQNGQVSQAFYQSALEQLSKFDQMVEKLGDSPEGQRLKQWKREIASIGEQIMNAYAPYLQQSAMAAEDTIRGTEQASYLIEYESGDGELLRQIFERMGFDGIIDHRAGTKFKNMNMDPDTTHYIVFDGRQAKAADNKGEWNSSNPNFYLQRKVGNDNAPVTREQLEQQIKAVQGMALYFSVDSGAEASPMEWFKKNVALPGQYDSMGIAPAVEEAAAETETESPSDVITTEETPVSETETESVTEEETATEEPQEDLDNLIGDNEETTAEATTEGQEETAAPATEKDGKKETGKPETQDIQDFGDGKIESIEAVPSLSGMYDEVYFLVNRGGARLIERMQDLKQADIQCFSWYVRSGLSYDAFAKTSGKTLSVSGTTFTSSAAHFTAAMVGNRIRKIDANYNMIAEGVITEYTSSTQVTVEVKKGSFGTGAAGGRWGVAVSSVSGLSHLEGKDVAILADGAVQPQKTVASGAILLDADAFVVIAGLPYQTIITTMPDENGAQNGTAVGKKKRMHEIAVRVYRTLGGRAGGAMDELQTIRYRDGNDKLGTAPELYTGIIPNIKYNQGWTYEADITLEQSDPLPMNILAVAPIVNEQDK